MNSADFRRAARDVQGAVVFCDGCRKPMGFGRPPRGRAYCGKCLSFVQLEALITDLSQDPKIRALPEWKPIMLRYAKMRRATPYVGDIIGGIGVSAFDVALLNEEVNKAYEQTDDDYGRAANQKKIDPAGPLFAEWRKLRSGWQAYYDDFNRVRLLISAPTYYARTKQWDLDRWEMVEKLRKVSPKSATQPPTPKPDPHSVPGPTPGSSDAGLFGGLSTLLLSAAALAGALYLLSGRLRS